MKRIVVFGPPGCGKTRAATALAAHFGVEVVVDDFDPRIHELLPGALHLSHMPWPDQQARSFEFAEINFDQNRQIQVTHRRAKQVRRFDRRWNATPPTIARKSAAGEA